CACTDLARLLTILLPGCHLTTIALNKHTARNFSLVYSMTLIRRRHSNSLRRQRLHMQRRMPSELRRLRPRIPSRKTRRSQGDATGRPHLQQRQAHTNIMRDGRHIWMLRAIAA
ncbi:hypothetical protein BC831DRAFT_442147, partial [Entophlyctis helioformis]